MNIIMILFYLFEHASTRLNVLFKENWGKISESIRTKWPGFSRRRIVLVKRVKRICSPLREFFSKTVIGMKKKNIFFFHKLLLHKSMQYRGEEYSSIFIVSLTFSIKVESL